MSADLNYDIFALFFISAHREKLKNSLGTLWPKPNFFIAVLFGDLF